MKVNLLSNGIFQYLESLGPAVRKQDVDNVVLELSKAYDEVNHETKQAKYINLATFMLMCIGFRLSTLSGNQRSPSLRVGGFSVYLLAYFAHIGYQQMIVMQLGQ